MDEKKDIPYIVHEGAMARMERSNRRLLIALAISMVVMLLNNIAWLVYDNVTNIINEYKRNNEVPEAMQILYEYLHERQIKWASKIKAKQEQFK